MYTQECEALSNVSIYVVQIEAHRFQLYAFSLAFSKSSVFTAGRYERKTKMVEFSSVFI